MINAAATNKTVKVFVDHVNLLVRQNEDDVYGHIEPPKVISPRKGQRAAKRKYTCDEGTRCNAANIEEEDEYIADEREDHYREESDSESDSYFHDSDYEVDKGDDDLYNENVDEVGDGEKEAVAEEVEEVDALDDPQLDMPGESRHKIGYKFKTFEPDFDMNNPVFKLGMKFSNVKELRNALASYTVRNRVKIVKTINTASILNAHCDCKLDEFRDDEKMSLKSFATKVRKEFNMVPKRWKLGRARKAALTIIHGDEEAQFTQLWDFGQELRRTWDKNMEKMKTDNPSAFDWVEELAPNTWVKAFFNDFPKCDLLLNNHCEVFNRRWQLSGIPCGHALACCRDDRLDLEDLVHSCYIVETYLKAYGSYVVPLRSKEHWEKMSGIVVHPPLYTKTIGRPKKNRKKDPSEKDGKLTKHGVTMHCSIRKSADHNKNGHKNHIARSSQPEGVGQEEFDDPTILAEVMPRDGIFHTDPSEMPDSMVYNLLHEERASRIPEWSLP
ncbi:hypothetical protein ACQ4PT_028473 [Festuca glaucescens]